MYPRLAGWEADCKTPSSVRGSPARSAECLACPSWTASRLEQWTRYEQPRASQRIVTPQFHISLTSMALPTLAPPSTPCFLVFTISGLLSLLRTRPIPWVLYLPHIRPSRLHLGSNHPPPPLAHTLVRCTYAPHTRALQTPNARNVDINLHLSPWSRSRPNPSPTCDSQTLSSRYPP